MRSLLQDFRHSLRSFRRTPGLAVVVVATVAAGIAASTTVFALIDALFLRPLPGVTEQARLVNVHATAPDGSTFHSVSYPTWRDIGDGGGSFEGLAAFSSRVASLSNGKEPQLAIVQLATGNYFQVLGVRPQIGRFFGPEEDAVPGRDAVVVLGDSAWKSRFGADPGVVGRTVSINGHPFTIVGVAPPGFAGTFLAFPFDVWVPTMMAPALSFDEGFEARDRVWLEMVGRLAPGVGLASARDRMGVLAARLARDYPGSQRGVGYDLRPATGFEDSLRGSAVGFFAIMGALAGLVLAVAGINVAGVLLARAFAREKEIGLRLALGARRSRIVRLLLVETLVLFAAGGALGALLATPTARLLARFRLPTAVPIVLDLAPNPRSAAFALLAAAVGGLIFGLAAALPATRGTDASLLRAGAATERRSAARLRSAFVSLQLAGSVLLLVTAGLFVRTVRHAATVNPGFDPQGLSMTTIDISMLGYDAARGRDFFDRLMRKAAQWPEVEAVTITGVVPLGLNSRETSVHMPGHEAPADAVPVDFTDVGESYFSAMRIPILQGRAFQATDAPDAPETAIVNETLASKLWPGREPIGQVLVEGGRPRTVVGVARNGKYRRPWETPRAYLYLPFRQQGRLRENLVVRSRGSAESIAALLRAEMRQLEPALPLGAVFPVREHIALSVLPQRLAAQVAAGLGALGLALSAIGLAGLVAYSISRRTREIGVRMALGAAPADVLRLEMGRGVRVAAGGLALGMAAALIATSLIKNFLFGVDAADPATFGGVLLLLLCVALAACYFPARRAARVSPSEALRSH